MWERALVIYLFHSSFVRINPKINHISPEKCSYFAGVTNGCSGLPAPIANLLSCPVVKVEPQMATMKRKKNNKTP